MKLISLNFQLLYDLLPDKSDQEYEGREIESLC